MSVGKRFNVSVNFEASITLREILDDAHLSEDEWEVLTNEEREIFIVEYTRDYFTIEPEDVTIQPEDN